MRRYKGWRRGLVALLTALLCVGIADARRLVDAETGAGLPLASVTDSRGNVVALTDKEGAIPDVPQRLFPLTFSYVGYSPVQVAALGEEDVVMTPCVYQLPDMVISPGDRPVVYLKGYMRAVTTLFGSSDSITLLKEGIVDFLIPVGKTKVKGWNKPRELASKAYERSVNRDGLTSVRGESDYPFMIWTDKFPLLPSDVKSNNPKVHADSVVNGKYGVKMTRRRQGDTMRVYSDGLADRENHVMSPSMLKLLGMTTDFTDISIGYVYTLEEDGSCRPLDISQISVSLDMTIRGKLIKTAFHSDSPVDVKCYVEVYITDREYLSTDEAKYLSKHKPTLTRADVKAPAGVPPLHPALQSLVNQVEGK